ncbi:glycosyltransferase family 39 protein [Mucilaginibacter myungsuensis]
MPHFGFHRDELLHLVLADHLDWGYKEVPPFIAVLAFLTKTLFGTSVFAARVFSTLFGALIIWLTGKMVVEFGGRKFAISIACLSMIFAPAFMASQYLFQPVVFDQFWWVISVWLLVKYVNSKQPKYLYWLSIAVGLGMLTKYSMAFFAFSLLAGLLISKQRKLLFNKHILIAVGIAIVIFLPNVIWQVIHHFPVLTHMRELKEQQLDYVDPTDFYKQQLLVNGMGLFIWLTGFVYLIFSFRLRNYQFLAFAYIFVFAFLVVMHGKAYYLFGAYPMLFAAGGFALEQLLRTARPFVRTSIATLLIMPNLIFLPLLLPVFPIGPTLGWFRSVDRLGFFDFAVTWEDQKKHPLTQDYADMFGWEEMAQKAAQAYHSLTPEQQKETILFAGNYGEAGALHQFKDKYKLPQVISLNSSFTLWAPDTLKFKYFIYVDEEGDELEKAFGSMQKMGEVTDSLAREKGTQIYLYTDPKPVLFERYNKELAKKRLQ